MYYSGYNCVQGPGRPTGWRVLQWRWRVCPSHQYLETPVCMHIRALISTTFSHAAHWVVSMLTLLVRRVPWMYVLLFCIDLMQVLLCAMHWWDWCDMNSHTHCTQFRYRASVFGVFACPVLCVSKHVLLREYLVCCLIVDSEAGLYTVPSSNYHVSYWHMHTVLVGC